MFSLNVIDESVWRGIILSRGVADSLGNARDRASGPVHPRDTPEFLVIISNPLLDEKELDQVRKKALSLAGTNKAPALRESAR